MTPARSRTDHALLEWMSADRRHRPCVLPSKRHHGKSRAIRLVYRGDTAIDSDCPALSTNHRMTSAHGWT